MSAYFSYRELVLLLMLGMMAPVFLSCASSVPTETPSSQFSPPSGIPTSTPLPTPVVAPQVGFPPDSASTAPTTDIEATVTAMVAATVAAMPTATPELSETVEPPADATGADVPATGGAPSPSVEQGPVVDISTPVAEAVLSVADVGEDSSAPSNEDVPVAPVTAPSNEEETGDATAASVAGSEPDPDGRPEPEPEREPTPAPSPTPQVEPTARPEPTPTPRLGSRANPVPLGAAGVVRDSSTRWEISVENITSDAWDLIREENQFNAPPEEGKQFYLLRLSAKNVGEQRRFFVPYVKTVGEARALGYTTSGDSCGVYPGSNSREVFPGGQFSLNVCWEIFSDDLPTLMMYWDEWPTPQTMWFDLR